MRHSAAPYMMEPGPNWRTRPTSSITLDRWSAPRLQPLRGGTSYEPCHCLSVEHAKSTDRSGGFIPMTSFLRQSKEIDGPWQKADIP